MYCVMAVCQSNRPLQKQLPCELRTVQWLLMAGLRKLSTFEAYTNNNLLMQLILRFPSYVHTQTAPITVDY